MLSSRQSLEAHDLETEIGEILAELWTTKTYPIFADRAGKAKAALLKTVDRYVEERERSARETILEEFRVFCYEKGAFEAWDTPQSNRQGWLDTKLRDFIALRQQVKGGE